MDLNIYDYKNAFGITLGMTKAEPLMANESSMTYTIVITPVHLDSNGGPVRYRVENSWRDAAGDHGYFVITDEWFDEFVYQLIIPRKLAAPDHLKVLDGGQPKSYYLWDPMGTLA